MWLPWRRHKRSCIEPGGTARGRVQMHGRQCPCALCGFTSVLDSTALSRPFVISRTAPRNGSRQG